MKPPSKDEREKVLALFLDRWSIILANDSDIDRIIRDYVEHLKEDHSYTHNEAVKLIISINCESLRMIADKVEELTVDLMAILEPAKAIPEKK